MCLKNSVKRETCQFAVILTCIFFLRHQKYLINRYLKWWSFKNHCYYSGTNTFPFMLLLMNLWVIFITILFSYFANSLKHCCWISIIRTSRLCFVLFGCFYQVAVIAEELCAHLHIIEFKFNVQIFFFINWLYTNIISSAFIV